MSKKKSKKNVISGKRGRRARIWIKKVLRGEIPIPVSNGLGNAV